MKAVSSALAAHLAEECATLAYLIKLTRTDGAVLGFTNHDRDLTVAGVTYRADSAVNPSALVSQGGLAPDNLSLDGALHDAAVTEADILDGRYNRARCDVYVCNWADLTQGVLQLRRGWLGAVTLQDGQYRAELRGLHDRLQQEIGAYYTPECRHALGDAGCTVALAPLTVTSSVTAVTAADNFTDTALTQATGWFDYGLVAWLSGANAGLTMEVRHWDSATHAMSLWLPMPALPQVGDSYTVTAGCDKRFSTCRGKFGNALNFGGFPHVPGLDRILDYPDSKA